MEENKKVCILTAGKGSRIGPKSDYFNKSLLRIGNKAVLSHIIDSFSGDIEFVIGLGYKSSIVRQYLEMFHESNNITYVEIDKYSEPGSGPGYAIKKCKPHLMCPFYFISCDSMIDWSAVRKFEVQNPKQSWAAISKIPRNMSHKYCTVQHEANKIIKIFNKTNNGSDQAFTGVAYINDFEEFWINLYNEETLEPNKEIPIAPSILNLREIMPLFVSWYDTGNENSLKKAMSNFEGIQNLDKLDEELYVKDGYVVKYFHNSNIVKNRMLRVKTLKGVVPKIEHVTKNFYKYKFIEGCDLFKVEEPSKEIVNLLNYAQNEMWSKLRKLNKYENSIFRDICLKFYYDKTKSRLAKYYDKSCEFDASFKVNGTIVPKTDTILSKVDWNYISNGIPAKFHGDFNFSNIVKMPEGTFKFLDWRQDFGSLIEYGDVYYDLAKMYHSFLVPHTSIINNQFYFEKANDEIKLDMYISSEIKLSKNRFENFIERAGYSLHKIKILTAIVLLNMSPLHEFPLDKYLYYFGKKYLHDVLENDE